MATTDDDWHQTDDVLHEQGRGDPFAAAVRSTRMPMIVSDPRKPDNPIVYTNDAFLKLTGYERDEILGRNCRFLQGPETDRAEVRRLRDAIVREEPIQIDLLNYRKDGTSFWNALFMGPVHGDDGQVQFFFASQIDVTERVQAQKAVARQKAIVEAEVQARTKELKDALAANERALEEKTLLLHEVDHRVKNNLTMIGSLLRLQVNAINDPVSFAPWKRCSIGSARWPWCTRHCTTRRTSAASTLELLQGGWCRMCWRFRAEKISRSSIASRRSTWRRPTRPLLASF